MLREWRDGCGRCLPVKTTDNDDPKVELFAVRCCLFSVRDRLRRSQVRARFDGLAIPPPTYSVDAIGGG